MVPRPHRVIPLNRLMVNNRMALPLLSSMELRHSNLTANKAINNLNMVPPLQVNTLLSNKVNMVPLLQALLQDSMGAPLHNSHTANKGNILLLSSLHMASSHRDINSPPPQQPYGQQGQYPPPQQPPYGQ